MKSNLTYYIVGFLIIFSFALTVYNKSDSAIYSWDHLIADEAPLPAIDPVPFIDIPHLQEN